MPKLRKLERFTLPPLRFSESELNPSSPRTRWSPEWDMTHTLNPCYHLTPSTQFVEKFIPREAAHVRQLTADTRNADSIYLVHYTTPDDWKSYLVHGYKGSDERDTQEWVKGIIVKTIKDIGIDKTAAIVSDSTGNTRAGQQDAQREIPILLNLGDCCHHIQLTIQDINRIGDFQEFIKTLNAAIRFFTQNLISPESKLRKLFSKGEAITGITPSISSAVSTIVSRRFKAFVNESPMDIYLTAFFLHPSYSTSDALLHPASVSHTIHLPARAQNQPLPTVEIPYPNAFKRAKKYLKKILCDEAEYYKANPMMPQSPIGQIICKLKPIDGKGETGNVLTWWRDLSSHPLAQVLALLATKIFSTLVNSMPDKRTGSRLTWLNLPTHSSQKVEMLINMIQVGQWYGSHIKEIPHKHIRCKPTVSFIDVNREFAIQSRSSESASNIGDDHEGNSNPDLDADDEDITEDNLIQPILDGLVMLNLDADSDININSEFLSQYLTESGPPTQNPKTTAMAAAGDENPLDEDANWDSN
ncbi:hypothetical protein F5887DRAFT_1071140 [Amanita rubescens]|nr:hypothetical protein F5887DRAFT_1071140 [Amanita rubescens]